MMIARAESLLIREPLPGRAQCLLCAVLILVGLGMALLFSASSGLALQLRSEPFYFVVRQMQGVCLGGSALLIAAWVRPQVWLRLALPFGALTVLMLASLFVPGLGLERNQATRWLNLMFFEFQPSELAKLAIPLAIAWSVHRFGLRGPGAPGLAGAPRRVSFRLLQVLVLGTIVTLVALEPDYGTALFLAAVGGALLLLSGMPIRYPLLAALPFVPMSIWFFERREHEILERMRGLLAPETLYQVQRSLYAIGSGGLWGKGFGRGAESAYLPERQTDFIFSILGEELGFVGILLLLGLFTVILQSGWRVVRHCPSPALRLLAFGILLNIVLQACINIAVATASAPTKGIPLPFLSFGSSGMTMFLFQVGIIVGIARDSHGRTWAGIGAEGERMTGPVIFAGAASGGHLYPGIAVAAALREHWGVASHFASSGRPLEDRILSETGFPVQPIPGGRGPRDLWKQRGAWRRVFSELAPAAVFGLGGAPSLLGAAGARRRRVPFFLHEQNRVLGRANRWLLRLCTRAFLSFPDTASFAGAGARRALRRRALYLGCPVRSSFRPTPVPCGAPLLLVMGGSQGAEPVNRCVLEALSRLERVPRVFHVAGPGKSAAIAERYAELAVDAEVVDYLPDPGARLAAAALVVARAGATTVAELMAVGRGAILLPYPHHRDRQQFLNAEVLARAGAARVVAECPESLATALRECLAAEELRTGMAHAAATLAVPEAAQHIAQVVATHIDAGPGRWGRELHTLGAVA